MSFDLLGLSFTTFTFDFVFHYNIVLPVAIFFNDYPIILSSCCDHLMDIYSCGLQKGSVRVTDEYKGFNLQW